MRDLILFIIFILIMAYLQERSSQKVLRYNTNLTSTQSPKRDKGIYMMTTMVVMMALAMFRGISVGSDTSEYHRIFEDITLNGIINFEIGYVYLNLLVGKFTTNPQSIIIVTSIIYYIVFIWFIKRHCNNYALLLLLFFLIILDDTVNIIRQELAVAFLLIGIDRILNKHSLFAIFWIIVASLFHQASLFFIIFVFVPYIRYNHIISFAIVVAVIICTFTDMLYRISLIIAPSYANYFSGKYSGIGFLTVTYTMIKNLSFLITVILIREKSLKGKNILPNSKINSNKQYNLVVCAFFLAFIFSIMAYKMFIFIRLEKYLSMLNIVLLSTMISHIKNKQDKIILTSIIVVVLMAYTLVYNFARPDWNSTFPYQFFWQT